MEAHHLKGKKQPLHILNPGVNERGNRILKPKEEEKERCSPWEYLQGEGKASTTILPRPTARLPIFPTGKAPPGGRASPFSKGPAECPSRENLDARGKEMGL